jgi:predicted TIM-barrel fold metal-dependent hydrolase
VAVRLFGEDGDALAAAGADLDALRALEEEVAGQVASLPRGDAIDAHVHLGRDADGHHLDVADLLADLERWGIGAAVCFPANEPGPDGQFAAANAAVLAAAGAAPGRVIPFCRVDPRRPGALDAIARAAAAGARGLKLHPVAQRFRPESDEAVAVVREASLRGWPITLHAGFGARPLAAGIGALVQAVPEARLVLAHGGRGDARAIAARLGGWPNVMLDTSLAALADLVTLPPARLVFGSDRPYGDHGTALLLVRRAADVAGWGDDDLAMVMGGNLRRWVP